MKIFLQKINSCTSFSEKKSIKNFSAGNKIARNLLFIFFLFISSSLFAHHLKGGWISYQYLGNGALPNTSKYKITVKQYLLCGSTDGQIDNTIYLGVFNGASDSLLYTLVVTLDSTVYEKKISYGCVNHSSPVCYRVDRYVTTVDLPNNSAGYILSVQRCCRIDGIVNLAGSDSMGLTYTNTIPGLINSISYRNNNSPLFSQKDTSIVCQNNYFTFDFSATDVDNDSLVYSFTYGLKGGNQNPTGIQPNPPILPPPPYDSSVSINYSAGYTWQMPMGPGVTINSSTGLVSGIAPGTIGDYVLAVAVKEYRNGVLIGVTRKELHISVAACTVLSATTSQVNVQCLSGPTGSATAVASGGVAPYIYSWNTSPVQNTSTASGLTPGTYTVTISDSNTCTTSKSVTIVPVPKDPAAGNNGPLCEGATLKLTSTTITGTNYNWTGPNGFTSTLQNPVINNVTSANAGIYTVSATINNCGGKSSSTTVIVNSLPPAPAVANNGPLCVGSTLNLNASTITGATYFWSGPNGFTSNVQNPVVMNVAISNAGVYSVYVMVNGCNGPAASTNVVVNSIPITPVVSSNSPVCAGSNLILNSSTILNAAYSWTGPNGFTSTLQNPILNNMNLSMVGFYKVNVIVDGCQSSTGSTYVDYKSLPSTPVPGNNGPLCSGSTLNLTASTISGATYSWSGPNGFSSTVQNPVISNASTLNSGIYSVVAISNGCSSPSGTTSVTIKTNPQSAVASNNGPLCVGSTLNLSASTVAGVTYSWTGPNGFTSSVQNPIITNVSLINGGTYSVITSSNGCNSSASSTTVVVNAIPQSAIASNNGPLCVGSALNLKATTIAGVTYNWTGPNGFTSTDQNPIITNVSLLNAGSYSVTTSSNGCSSSSTSTTVVVNAIPQSAVASNNGPLCVGSTLNLSATTVAGVTYSWIGPNGFTSSTQNPIISNVSLLNAGSYSVTTSSNGCSSSSSSTTVVVNPIPQSAVASNNGPLCVGSTLNLSATTVAGVTYNWTGPNGFTSTDQNPVISNITLLNAGSYSVTTSSNGCSSSSTSTTVVVNAIPQSAVASNNGPLCVGSTLNLSATTVAGVTYSWIGPNGFTSSTQNPIISNVSLLNAGSYSVTTSSNGCSSSSSSTTVVVNPIPQSAVASNNGPLCVGSTLNLSATTVAGVTYNWTGPNGFTSTDQNPVISNITLLNAGSYSVTTSSNGCSSSSSSTTVVVNPIPQNAVASNNGPLCVGSTLGLSATTVAGVTYSWTGPNGFTSTDQNPIITNVSLINTGSYLVTTSSNGCSSSSSSTTVVVNPIPQSAVASNNGPLCVGSTLNLSATTVAGVTYSWTGPNGFSSSDQNPIITNVSLINAGSYSVTTSSNGCSSSSSSTTVVVNPIPQSAVASNNGPLCVGSTLNLSSTTVAGVTYSWTGPNGFTSTDQNPILTNVSLINAGSYSVTTSSNGCSSSSSSTTVVVNAIPQSAVASNNGPLCVGSTLNLSATTVAGVTYSWTGPNGFTSTTQNPIITNVSLINGGTYSVITSSNGCSSSSSSTTVVVNPIPQSAVASNNGPLCVGSTLNLSATTVAGVTYSWTGPNGFTSTDQNPVIPNITLLYSGSYSVTTSSNGCSSSSSSTTVVVNPIPQSAIASNNGPLCVGSTLNLSSATVAGVTYSWTGPNGFTSADQNPTINNVSLVNVGSYSVTTSSNGCRSSTSSTTVVVNPIPQSAIASNNGPLCVGSTLNLSATTVSGATYSWTGPNGFVSTDQNPVIPNITLLNAGSYSVTTSSNGCSSTSSSTTVVVNPIPPSAIASNNGPLCVGSTLNLSSTTVAGVTYSWTGPNGFTSTTQNPIITNVSLLSAGSYSVSTSSNGCSSLSSSTTVVVNPIPQSAVASNNGPLCVGSTLGLSATTVAGVTYSWTGPNGFTSTDQNPIITNVSLINTGSYLVTTSSNGCSSSSSSTTVVVNPIPQSAVASNNGPLCVGSTLNLSATTVAGVTYSWTGPNGFTSTDQNPIISNVSLLNAGSYSVTTSSNGCSSSSSSTTVVVNPIPQSAVASNNGPLCVGSTLNLSATTVSGATYSWTGPNGFVSTYQNPIISNITLLNAGSYSVTTSSNGCSSSSSSTTVIVNPIPQSAVATNNGPLCVGSTLNLSASTVAGVTYNWTGPNGFTSSVQNPVISNITLLNAGSYSVTTSSNGCSSSSSSTTVVVNPIPQNAVASNNGPLCVGSTLNLSATAVAGVTYNWMGPNGFTSTDQNPIITNVSLINTGSYLVTTSSNGCSSSSSSTTVVVNPIPQSAVASNNGPLCVGSTLNLSATTVAGVTYSWTGPNGFTSSTDQNPIITNVSLINAGSYSVTTSSNGCSSSTSSTTVVINPIPQSAVASNNGPLCVGSTLNLSAITVAGVSYSWTGPNGFTSTDQNPVIPNITLLNSGSYSVTTSSNGCSSSSSSTTVVVNPIPQNAVASNNGPLCVGSTLNLSASTVAGVTYNWTGPNGFTSSTQNPIITNVSLLSAGSYSVTTSSNGCSSSSSSTTVVVNPIPQSAVASNNGPLCVGSTLNLSCTTVAGVTYSWTGPNGFTSSTQNPIISNVSLLNAGSYSVTTSSNGCSSSSSSTTVIVNAIPQNAVASNNGPLCAGSTLNLSATTVAGVTYSWTGPNGFSSSDQNPIITNVSLINAGSYSVTTSSNGCSSSSSSTTVVVNPIPQSAVASNNGPLCVGSTLNLSSTTVAGVTYSWTGPNGFTSTDQNPILTNVSLINAGSYSVTTSSNGCSSSSSSTTVVVNAIPQSAVASNNGPLCVGSTLNLSATTVAGVTYSWTGPNGFTSTTQNPIITNVSLINGGTYSVITSSNGCSSSSSSTAVVVNAIPQSAIASNNGPLCVGSTLNLSATTVAGVSYSWTGPNGFTSTDQNPILLNVSLINGGSYSVTTSSNSCSSSSSSTTVVVNPIPQSAVASNNGPLCVGSTLNLSATTVAGVTYSWTGPKGFTSTTQNPTITNVSLINGGSYSVTTSSNGCSSSSSSTTVVVNAIPQSAVASNNGPLCVGSTLNLSATTVAGVTYSWTGPNGFTSTTQNPIITNVSLLSAGSYSVTTSSNGCSSSSSSTTVVVNPIPQSAVASNNGPLCVGSTLNLSATTVAGVTYSWTGPNGFSSSDQNPVISNITLLNAGSYSVITSSNGCSSSSSSTTVVVNAIPQSAVASNNGPLCVGSTLNLSSTTVAGVTYSWTGPNGFSSSDQNPVIPNITLLNAGSYFVTTSSNGCSSSSSSTTVVVNPIPQSAVASNNGPLCVGSTLNLSATTVAGVTYSWTGPNGFTSTDQNPIISNVSLLNAGSYSVTTSSNGCSSSSSSTTVVVNPIPQSAVASNNGPLCVGSTLNLSSTTVAGVTYSWTGPNGFTSSTQNPIISNVSLLNAGSYSVTTSSNGCSSSSSSTTVVVNAIPQSAVASNNGPLCVGSTLNLSATAVAGVTYNWTGPNGFTSTDQNPVISNITLLNAGSYSVITSSNGCSSSSSSTTVVVNPIPPSAVASNNGPLCVGSTLNLSATAVAGVTYNWTGPNGFMSSVQNPIITNVSLIDGGTYSVITSSNGCSSSSSSTTVVVNAIPQSAVASNNGPLCVGSTLNLSATTVAGVTYSWTGPNGFNSSDQNPIITNISLLNAGSYFVTTSSNGCSSASSSTTVVVNPIPQSAVASNNGPLCVGSTLNLNATTVAGVSYSWTGPNGFSSTDQNPVIPNISLLNAGSYSVTTSSNVCSSSSSSTTVVVNAIPQSAVASNNGPLCAGSTLNLSATTVAGVTYNWTGPNGFVSTDQNPVVSNTTTANSGTYFVTTSSKSCNSISTSTNVIINAIPAPAVASNNGPLCLGTNLSLTASTVALATYNWKGPLGFTSTLQNPVINAVTQFHAGVYSVTISVNGCTSPASSTNAIINPKLSQPPTSNNGPLCEGATLKLISVYADSATYSWSGPNGFTSSLQNPEIPNVSQKEAGTYQLILSVLGCNSPVSTLNVVVNKIPAKPLISDNNPVCSGGTLDLKTNQYADGNYIWSGPNGFNLIGNEVKIANVTQINSGVYKVVLSSNGCNSLPAMDSIVINSHPEAQIITSNDPVCEGGELNFKTSSVLSGKYNWTGPNGFVSKIQNPEIDNVTMANSGIYKLIVVTNGCAGPENLHSVIVKPLPGIPVAGNNGKLCEGDLLKLNISGDPNMKYSWTGPGGFLSNLQNPIIKNVKLADSGLYKAIISLNGCSSPEISTRVIINAHPSLPTLSSNAPLCEGGSLQLSVNEMPNTSYSWIGPNNFSSKLAKPVLNNINISNGGKYTATAMENGCQSENLITVTINPIPEGLKVSNNGPLCLGSNLILTGELQNNQNYNITPVYEWSGPNGFASSLPNPTIISASKANSGVYKVKFSVNGCFSKSTETVVDITEPIKLDAGTDQSFCNNIGIINLSATASDKNKIFWTSSGTGTFSPNNKALDALYLLSKGDKNSGHIKLSLSSSDSSTCPANHSFMNIDLLKAPLVNAGQDQTFCNNIDTINLNGKVTPNKGLWTTNGDGTFYPDANTVNANYIPGKNDKQINSVSLKLSSIATSACPMVSDSIKLKILTAPTIKMGKDNEIFLNEYITIHPAVTGNIIEYLWSPSQYLDRPDIKDPVAKGVADHVYKLHITDRNGCVAEDKILITVLRPIIIPNTFTPNGDGINDTWNVDWLYQYKKSKVQVFNRYGQLMFESIGYDKPWDGTFKGKPLPWGTYYYVIEIGHGKPGVTGYVTIIK